jgi:hypothetical protein
VGATFGQGVGVHVEPPIQVVHVLGVGHGVILQTGSTVIVGVQLGVIPGKHGVGVGVGSASAVVGVTCTVNCNASKTKATVPSIVERPRE